MYKNNRNNTHLCCCIYSHYVKLLVVYGFGRPGGSVNSIILEVFCGSVDYLRILRTNY